MNEHFQLKMIFTAGFILALVISFGQISVVKADGNPPAEPPTGDEPSVPPPEDQSRKPEPEKWVLDPLEGPGFIRFDIAPPGPHRFCRIPGDDREKEPKLKFNTPSAQISLETAFLPLLIGSPASAKAYNQIISALPINSDFFWNITITNTTSGLIKPIE
jgi:hypothetical protein